MMYEFLYFHGTVWDCGEQYSVGRKDVIFARAEITRFEADPLGWAVGPIGVKATRGNEVQWRPIAPNHTLFSRLFKTLMELEDDISARWSLEDEEPPIDPNREYGTLDARAL